mmetsp:Transcript_1152/g.2654  ORF Transcript_1152/g.2654 Transcript_1152/m.2654 type:complete len:320 (+) Transcript_1152:41-1000(+)
MAAEDFFKCCGSRKWASLVAQQGPFTTKDGLLAACRDAWWNGCNVNDWFEAFTAHPRIGDVSELAKKFASTADLCSNEQSAAMESAAGNKEVLAELKEWNDKYFDKNGFIFIIFATGKTAEQVLGFLKERYENTCAQEAVNAAIEQMKITELRLVKLFPNFFPEGEAGVGSAGGSPPKEEKKGGILARTGKILAHIAGADLKSPITSHILDIANGKPAYQVPIKLERLMPGSKDAWDLVGKDVTNMDGRSTKLMAPSATVLPGVYKISFDTRFYEQLTGTTGFYPHASIVFEIGEHQIHQHFHVPLLYSPFGYSTYRGS